MQFEDEQGRLSGTGLLSTLTELSADTILQYYEKRWCCEPMFNQLKHAGGLQETWQQTRQVLHCWVQCRLGLRLVPVIGVVAEGAIERIMPMDDLADSTAHYGG